MAISVQMPALGESVTEGTVTRWLKQEGDTVEQDEPEFPAEAARYVGGERRLQGVLVGHVMKKSKGSADPKRVNQLLAVRSGT